MSKFLRVFDISSKIFNVLAINALVIIVVVIALRVTLEYRIEQKQDRIVDVMSSATKDNVEHHDSIMRVLLGQEAYQSLAAPWVIRMSALEVKGFYAERDTAFFKALEKLDPIEMKLFLNTTKEMISGFPDSVVHNARDQGRELPPVINMSQFQREAIMSCQRLLNRTVNIVPKDQYHALDPLEKSFNDYRLAFPDRAFEGCDL